MLLNNIGYFNAYIICVDTPVDSKLILQPFYHIIYNI